MPYSSVPGLIRELIDATRKELDLYPLPAKNDDFTYRLNQAASAVLTQRFSTNPQWKVMKVYLEPLRAIREASLNARLLEGMKTMEGDHLSNADKANIKAGRYIRLNTTYKHTLASLIFMQLHEVIVEQLQSED